MADRQLVMAPEVIFKESCCLSILLAVENGPPARAEGLVKLSVGKGEYLCSAAALWRGAATEPYRQLPSAALVDVVVNGNM